jgi:hypothetical protein
MTAALRHYCRKCRTKLAEPTDNPHRAFCCRGCFNQFHRSRCVVCEGKFRRRNERQRICIDVRCKSELRRFPEAYAWPTSRNVGGTPSEAHFTGIKSALSGNHGGIIGPARVIAVEIGREWQPGTSSDGVPFERSTYRKRYL